MDITLNITILVSLSISKNKLLVEINSSCRKQKHAFSEKKKREQEKNGTKHLLTLMDEFYAIRDLLTIDAVFFINQITKKKSRARTDS